MMSKERYKLRIEAQLMNLGATCPAEPGRGDFRFVGWDDEGNVLIAFQAMGSKGPTGLGNIRLVGPPEEIVKLLGEFERVSGGARFSSRGDVYQRRRDYLT